MLDFLRTRSYTNDFSSCFGKRRDDILLALLRITLHNWNGIHLAEQRNITIVGNRTWLLLPFPIQRLLDFLRTDFVTLATFLRDHLNITIVGNRTWLLVPCLFSKHACFSSHKFLHQWLCVMFRQRTRWNPSCVTPDYSAQLEWNTSSRTEKHHHRR